MEAVAAGAGVGKATVYRRWPTKDALIAEALDTLADDVEAVETGSLRDDLVAWLNALRRRNIQTLAGQIMPKLAAERSDHPELFATYSQRVLEPSRQHAAELLRRGIASEELVADVDVDLVVDMLVGPVVYRQYMSGDREVSGTRIGRIVDVVLDGIRRRDAPRPASVGGDTGATPGGGDGGGDGGVQSDGESPASDGASDPGDSGQGDSTVAVAHGGVPHRVGGPYPVVGGPYTVGGAYRVGGPRGAASRPYPVGGPVTGSGPDAAGWSP
jgi:AcrR family transcriptional regulator